MTTNWVQGPKTQNEPFPSNAYPACFMENGDIAYVAKANAAGHLVNGHTTRSALKAYCPFDRIAYPANDYEIMVSDNPENLYWEKLTNGTVPDDAVGGGEQDGQATSVAAAHPTLMPYLKPQQQDYRHGTSQQQAGREKSSRV